MIKVHCVCNLSVAALEVAASAIAALSSKVLPMWSSVGKGGGEGRGGDGGSVGTKSFAGTRGRGGENGMYSFGAGHTLSVPSFGIVFSVRSTSVKMLDSVFLVSSHMLFTRVVRDTTTSSSALRVMCCSRAAMRR